VPPVPTIMLQQIDVTSQTEKKKEKNMSIVHAEQTYHQNHARQRTFRFLQKGTRSEQKRNTAVRPNKAYIYLCSYGIRALYFLRRSGADLI